MLKYVLSVVVIINFGMFAKHEVEPRDASAKAAGEDEGECELGADFTSFGRSKLCIRYREEPTLRSLRPAQAES
jgi:hypothetical protein